MDISKIVADFGKFYIDEGQNRTRLISLLENSDDTTLAMFPTIFTSETKRRFGLTSLIGDILQPYQTKWTPRGQFKAEPLEISQYKCKVDVDEEPDDLEESWLSFKEFKTNEEDRSKWPFVRWMMEAHLLPRLNTNLGDASYWGRRVEPVEGVPGASREAYNGIRYLLNKGIQDGDVEPLLMGAVPTNPVDFVDYVEEMADMMPEKYRNMPGQFNMNTTLSQRYKEGFDQKYNASFQRNSDNTSLHYHPNLKVQGHISHAGSDKIWLTPLDNRVRMMDKAANASEMKAFHKEIRLVQITTHFFHGIGFKTGVLIWTNDVDLTI